MKIDFKRSAVTYLLGESVDVAAVILIVLAARQQSWLLALLAAVLISVRLTVRRVLLSRRRRRPPVRSVQPAASPEPEKSSGQDRTKVTDIIVALTGIAGLAATVWSIQLTHTDTHSQFNAAEASQNSARLATAAKDLGAPGNDNLVTRISGIEQLAQLTHDAPGQQPYIVSLLSTFVGNRTALPSAGPAACPDREPASDVQIALTTLGQRDPAQDGGAVVDLHGSCLIDADLHGVNLDYANLDNTNLDHADLGGANFRNAHFDHAHLVGATLTRAHFHGAMFPHADFTGDDLSGVAFDGANFTKDDANGEKNDPALLSEVHIGTANFGGANLSGEELAGDDMRQATLIGVYLMGAHLENARFDHVDARGGCFTNAHLQGAHFNGAQLDQPGPNKPAADFTGADVQDADFAGANVGGVTGMTPASRPTSDRCS